MKTIIAIVIICFTAVIVNFGFSKVDVEFEKTEEEKVKEFKEYEHWEVTLEKLTGHSIQPEEPKKEVTKESLFPKKKHLRLIGRLVEGITKRKLKRGGWYECGVLYSDRESIQEKALEYAYEIVRTSYIMSDKKFKLNPWELAGIIDNESGFDRCALGIYPRRHAYKMGLLEKKRFCISHTEEEVLFVLGTQEMQQRFARTGVDLGVGQVLSRFYDRPKDYKSMMEISYGTMQAGRIMRNRGRWYGTKQPSLYWRGTKTEWYLAKIAKRARKLGAEEWEI